MGLCVPIGQSLWKRKGKDSDSEMGGGKQSVKMSNRHRALPTGPGESSDAIFISPPLGSARLRWIVIPRFADEEAKAQSCLLKDLRLNGDLSQKFSSDLRSFSTLQNQASRQALGNLPGFR